MFGYIVKGSKIGSGEDDYAVGGDHLSTWAEAVKRGREKLKRQTGTTYLYVYDHGDQTPPLTAEDIKSKFGAMLIKVVRKKPEPDNFREEMRRELQREAAMLHGVQGYNDYGY